MVTDDISAMPILDRSLLGRWSAAARLNILIVFGFLSYAVLSGLTFGGTARLGESIDALIQVRELGAETATARLAIRQIGRLQDRLLVEHDVEALVPFEAEAAKAATALRAARGVAPEGIAANQLDTVSDGLDEYAERFRAQSRDAAQSPAASDAGGPRLQDVYSYVASAADALAEEVERTAAEAVDRSRRTQRLIEGLVLGSGGACAFLFLGVGLFAAYTVTRPLADLAETAMAIARGQLTATPPALANGDDIGRIARALDLLRKTLLEYESHGPEPAPPAAEAEDADAGAETVEPENDLGAAGLAFASRIGRSAAALTAAVTRLKASAETLAAAEERTQGILAQAPATTAAEAATRIREIAAGLGDLAGGMEGEHRAVPEGEPALRQAGAALERARRELDALAPDSAATAAATLGDIAEEARLLAINASLKASRLPEHGTEMGDLVSRLKSLARRIGEAGRSLGAWATDALPRRQAGVSALADIEAALGGLGTSDEQRVLGLKARADAARSLSVSAERAATEAGVLADALARLAGAAGESHGAAKGLIEMAEAVEQQSESLEQQIEDVLAA